MASDNFFLSKKSNGSLILRIEDTDQNRLVENAEDNLIQMLKQRLILLQYNGKK